MLTFLEEYQLGEVTLKVYEDSFNTKRYWLTVGIAIIELHDQSMQDLNTLLGSFVNERFATTDN